MDLERLKRRDPDAVREFILAHHRQLRGYVASLCLDVELADDLSQKVFVRALEGIGQVMDMSNFGSFLRGIARNLVKQARYQNMRPKEEYALFVERLHSQESDSGNLSMLERSEEVQALNACLSKLPERSRQMLHLRYSEEQQPEQIARELGLKGGAVRVALLRIRLALLKCMRGVVGSSVAETLP